MKSKIPKRLYSIDEAGTYLGRSACAVRELVWKGRLPAVRFDRRIFIDVRDLDALIDKNKHVETV